MEMYSVIYHQSFNIAILFDAASDRTAAIRLNDCGHLFSFVIFMITCMSLVQVTVTVLDVNDEPPRFTQSQYNVTLSEDAPVSSRPILTVHATDLDSGLAGRIKYSITAGDGTDKFHVDADTGALSVVAPLDYESKISYR